MNSKIRSGLHLAILGLFVFPLLAQTRKPPAKEPPPSAFKLVSIEVTGSKRYPQAEIIAATGLPGYESVGRFAIFVPLKTPEAIIARLNQEIVQVLNRGEVKDKLFSIGVEAVGSAPQQLVSAIKTEVSKWGKVIRDAGIRAE